MLQEDVVVEVERRYETGKNASNRLRARDMIPAVIYGGGPSMETLSLAVPRKSLLNLFRKGLHENTVFKLSLKGTDQQRHVMVRDVSVDPVSRHLLHIDFVRILLDRKLRVKVNVEAEGIAFGVKNEGGLLNIVTHQLLVECMPTAIPGAIKVDVTALKAREAIRVADLKLPDGVKVIDAPDRVVLHVGVPRVEEVAAPAAAVAVVPEAATSEPEVIKKGKKETEEAAAAAGKAEKKEKK